MIVPNHGPNGHQGGYRESVPVGGVPIPPPFGGETREGPVYHCLPSSGSDFS